MSSRIGADRIGGWLVAQMGNQEVRDREKELGGKDVTSN